MSSNSSRIGGGFTHEHYCGCPGFDDLIVTKVMWKDANLPGRGAWEVFRGLAAVFTFGLSTVVNGGLKRGTHDFIEVFTKCERCGHCMRITYDFGPDGKEKRVGYYNRYNSTRRWFKWGAHAYREVEKIYEGMPNRGYSLKDYNCGHWAKEMYWKVYNS